MLLFTLTSGFAAILISILVVAVPIVFVLELFGLTDFFDQEYDDHVKDCKREHPANFKRHEK